MARWSPCCGKQRGNSAFLSSAGGFAEKKHGQFYNTCPVINQAGDVVSKYRKVHLFSHYLNEHLYLHAGEEWVLTDYEQDDESILPGAYDLL